MATFNYSNLALELGKGTIDFTSHTFKIALLTSSYTPNQDSNTKWSDISGDEASGTGYTAGGVTVSSLTWTASENVITLDFDNISWANSSITARYAVLYDDSHTDDVLITCFDLGSEQVSRNGTFAIGFDSSGIFTVTITDA